MKTLFAKHKWMQLIYGGLLLAAGILIIVFAFNDQDNISKWLSIVVAIALFIYSAALLFSGVFSLKKKYFDLAFIFAVLFVSIGVCLVANPEMIGTFIVTFVATMLTAIGVVEIGEATAMIFFKRPVFFIVVFYLLGAAFMTLGILSFSFPETVQQIVYIGVGALLCVAALVEIVLGFHGLILAVKESKLEKATVVDAEVTDIVTEGEREEEDEKKEETPHQIEAKEEENKELDIIELDDASHHDNSNPDA